MFRSKKKSKAEPAAPQQQQTAQNATNLPPPPPPPTNVAPAAAAASTYTTTTPASNTTTSPPNTDKQLPSTLDKAQPAVPVEKAVAQSEPTVAPVKKESNIHAVSAASATPAIPPAPSAAFESDPAPAVPPKNDGVSDVVKPAGSSGRTGYSLSAMSRANIPSANHEDVSPLSASPSVEPTTPAAPAPTTATPEVVKPAAPTPAVAPAVAHSDEKMPVESETSPTPAKPAQTTNEMSATSGPLPDFPQGETKE